jgi:TraM recognition site of TraD and TraG/Helicase HerA, central domain
MTIPPLSTDNPLAADKLPAQPLQLKLPAVPQVQAINITLAGRFLLLAVFAQLMAILGLTMLIHQPEAMNTAIRLMNPLLVVYLLAATIRPFVRSPNYAWLLVGLSVLSGAVVAIVACRNGMTHPLHVYVLASMIHWLTELGGHYNVMASESIVVSDQMRQQQEQQFHRLICKSFVVILLAFMLASGIGVLAPMLGALFAIVAGIASLRQRNAGPLKAFEYYLTGYWFYPSANQLAPGQIPTPAGTQLSRIAIVAAPTGSMLLFAFTLWTQQQYWLSAGWSMLPFLMLAGVALLVTGHVGDVTVIRDRPAAWHSIIRHLRQSSNPIEANSLLLGFVAADQSPVLIDRNLCFQHIHVLGATGTNKSSMGLAPLIEQLISFGDSSVIVIDLKADSPELYYAAHSAVNSFRPGTRMQLFSLENGTQTQLFNPFLTSGWTKLGILERADILNTCCGLSYGFDYGPSFFTSCNSAVLRAANLANPDALSFRDLNDEIRRMLSGSPSELSPELRKAGLHATEVIGRLACYDSLNLTPNSAAPQCLDNRIELADYFHQPQVGYFRLPSTTSSIGAPSIARMILYYLIVAGRMTERKKNSVHVIIDEFQRVSAESLDQILQMARSHKISMVLANQSLSDLRVNNASVYQAVFGNCAIRQWFSVNSADDIDILGKLMGTREEIQVTETTGTQQSSRSYRTEHVPRARVTDLHTISENPFLSVLQVSGSGRGYARYNGIPFVCYNDYHISAEEFERRKKLPWPNDLPGMIEAREQHPPQPGPAPKRDTRTRHRRNENDDLFGPEFEA